MVDQHRQSLAFLKAAYDRLEAQIRSGPNRPGVISLRSEQAAVMQRINADLAVAPGDRATLLARLKSEDRAEGGLKGDLVAYEIIANALASLQQRRRHGTHPRCSATSYRSSR